MSAPPDGRDAFLSARPVTSQAISANFARRGLGTQAALRLRMEFMRNGGVNMWAMVVAFLAILVLGLRAKAERREKILDRGAVSILMLGMLGMATGMIATSKAGSLPSETAGQITAIGLGELANNGVLAAVLFVALQIASFTVGKRAEA